MANDRTDLLRLLLDMEERGWRALSDGTGADFYERCLTDDAIMVFSFGVLDRGGSIEAMRQAPRWSTFEIQHPNLVYLTDESSALVYQVTAKRSGQAAYRAWMTTVYVRQDGDWKVALHQQTPLQT